MKLTMVVALALVVAPILALKTSSDSITVNNGEANANPIRKVVSLLQKMEKKVEEEGEQEKDLFEKFQCHCKKTEKELTASIERATNGATQEDVDSAQASLEQLLHEVEELKKDKIASEASLQAASKQREKDHTRFEKEVTADEDTVTAVGQALQALNGTKATGLLQTQAWLPRLKNSLKRSAAPGSAQQKLLSFLNSADAKTAAPDAVTWMLKDVKTESEEEIVEETSEEKTDVKHFTGVKDSKNQEISVVLNTMERKMTRIGDLKVQIVNMKRDMSDSGASLVENKKMLSQLKTSCAEKSTQWDERQNIRNQELIALRETISMLNSDESLDLFKKTLPSPALIQMKSGLFNAQLYSLRKLLDLPAELSTNPQMNFLTLALSGKKVDMTKVLQMIDGMIGVMKKEADADETKKEYCTKEFSEAGSKITKLGKVIKELDLNGKATQEALQRVTDDIKALQDGIKALDIATAEATEERKAEHVEFSELIESNTQAVKLLGMAANRLNKVYSPSQFVDTTTPSPFDPYSLAQKAASLLHISNFLHKAAPATFGAGYKQNSNGVGVLGMIGTLTGELKQEMAVAKADETNSQKRYEEAVASSKSKREKDLASVQSKAKAKADTEEALVDSHQDKKAKEKKLASTQGMLVDLHKECDFLMQNYDLRKEARQAEQESLVTAKATLNSMSSKSFLQRN
eukprot:TRINITY_DN40762_c0_g1_i1.p1 TRINITY_DN40762_c0_g1~~TRINITY_DN40762_c0_g1_i1.p1  ORF type:complete len:692 (+),score=232.11 TRINITY_DN40762_c0_g1_i1:89-2164(+)